MELDSTGDPAGAPFARMRENTDQDTFAQRFAHHANQAGKEMMKQLSKSVKGKLTISATARSLLEYKLNEHNVDIMVNLQIEISIQSSKSY